MTLEKRNKKQHQTFLQPPSEMIKIFNRIKGFGIQPTDSPHTHINQTAIWFRHIHWTIFVTEHTDIDQRKMTHSKETVEKCKTHYSKLSLVPVTFLQSNFWILFSSTWCCVPFQFHTLSDFLLCGSNLTLLHLTQSAFSLFFLHHFSHLFFPFWLYLYECFLQGTQACSCSKTHRPLAHNISFISRFRRSYVHVNSGSWDKKKHCSLFYKLRFLPV